MCVNAAGPAMAATHSNQNGTELLSKDERVEEQIGGRNPSHVRVNINIAGVVQVT